MLREAIQSGIPIITVSTLDTIHLVEVLSYYAEAPVVVWNPSWGVSNTPKNSVFYALPNEAPSLLTKKIHDLLITLESVLIIVNRDTLCLEAFNVGLLETPKELIIKYLNEVVPEYEAIELSRYMTGLTIKQLVEVIRLTQVLYGNLDLRSLLNVRSQIVGQTQGLQQVPEMTDTYYPPQQLIDWLALNKNYFLNPIDARLTPRGLLFNGMPGVGKTAGAKFIAKSWGIPLYRLDLSSSLSKWSGESEANLSKILKTIDLEAPCVMLIDEVEKIFRQKEDTGITSRLLSQLLWWLQEHTAHVLVVMTTNSLKDLPLELYRAGRIDAVMEIEALNVDDAINFGFNILKELGVSLEDFTVNNLIELLHKEPPYLDKKIPHAKVIQIVYEEVKKSGLLLNKGE